MLKILPSHISNLIAAGEVVQRPSSVVKELVENSIDAGADKVSVIINDGGRTLIQVIDNGCGMNAEDAVLSFKRHATSKIDKAEDLQHIITYGFRGEALASIAAVAEITMKTRTADSETGTEVNIKASEVVSTSETSTPVGTNIAIRNIFYNVPARRKFMKSDATEFSRIADEFIHIAMIRTGIAFTLEHNGKKIFEVPASSNIKQRIQILVGKRYANDLVSIKNESSVIKINGFIGKPETALKKNESRQMFFVNDRYFTSPLMKSAVMSGYGQLLQTDKYPSFFIRMEVDPSKIDINIHPTKAEIKFEEESLVYNFLCAAVKESLGVNSFAPSIDFDTEGNIEIPSMVKTRLEFADGKKFPEQPTIEIDPDFDPFKEDREKLSQSEFADFEHRSSRDNSFFGSGKSKYGPDRYGSEKLDTDRYTSSAYERTESHSDLVNTPNTGFEQEKGYTGLFNESAVTSGRSFFILKGKYIITPSKSGIMAISIYRARKKIIYDRLSAAYKKRETASHLLLHPIILDIPVITFGLVKDHLETFGKMGFDIRIPEVTDKKNETQIMVYGTPMEELMSDMNALADAVESLAEMVAENPEAAQDELDSALREKHFIKLAGIGAREGASGITPIEAQAIIDTLFTSDNPGYTPDGEKTMNIITTEKIDNLF